MTHTAVTTTDNKPTNLISSLLMNHHELETKRKQYHEQQKSYVSALVGKL
jgi:hypothetical protein